MSYWHPIVCYASAGSSNSGALVKGQHQAGLIIERVNKHVIQIKFSMRPKNLRNHVELKNKDSMMDTEGKGSVIEKL